MDEFIKAQLDGIELSSQKMAQEARNISLRITAIMGYCAGQESSNGYSFYQNGHAALNGNLTQNSEFNESVSTPYSCIEETKEMMLELKIKGSVRERANGLIELRTTALGSIYGRSKEEIELKLNKKLKEVKAKKSKRKSIEFAIPTNFDKFAMYWFENFHKRKVKETSYIHDIKLYQRHIKNKFGTLTIKTIHPVLLQEFLDRFESKGKTADDLHSILNQIFNCAVKHGIINLNPLGMCFHTKHEKEHGRALSIAEENRLLNAYTNTPYRACFALILYTGLRPSEYSSAKIEGNFIKAVNRKRKNNKIEYKRIPISPMLLPYIDELAKLKMPTYYQLENRFKKIISNSKLYDLRTTFQTRCTECGIDDVAIGLFMGNTIGSELKKTYTDVSDEYLLREGKKLNY